MSDGGVLVVGPLDDGVNWTGLLAVSAVDALGHVDVVASGPSGAVGTRLALNCDGVCGAGSCAQLACDTSEFPRVYLSSPVG